MIVRAATAADAPRIAAIWNHYITDTTVTFTTQTKTVAEVEAYIACRQTGGMCVFVVDVGGHVTGFASTGPFRSGPGYAHSLEHSVMLAPGQGGRGAGRALLGAVEARARDGGAHLMVAGISGDNTDAIAFHAACGFVEAGCIKEAGRKFGRWLDLVLMQKRIGG